VRVQAGAEVRLFAELTAAKPEPIQASTAASAPAGSAAEEVPLAAVPGPAARAAMAPEIAVPVATLEKTSAEGSYDRSGRVFPLTVGVELGGVFSQVVSTLGSSPSVGLELGYLLPMLEQRLQVYGEVAYAQPKRHQTLSDPRLTNGGSYTQDITEQQLTVNLGGLFRLFPPTTRLNFHGQLGLRVNMQRSRVNGDATSSGFLENQETATRIGVHLAAGAEYMLGPGAVTAKLDFSATGLSHQVTGNSTAGGMGLLVGYHLLF
jgi:hypothetical protein